MLNSGSNELQLAMSSVKMQGAGSGFVEGGSAQAVRNLQFRTRYRRIFNPEQHKW
jgi:hypothetical protein